jgi:hypothetical protein
MNKFKKLILQVLFYISVATLIFSCRKDLPENLFTHWNPTGAAPVATMSLTLADVINTNDSNIVIESDGFIRFVYRRDPIDSFDVSKIYKIPTQQPDIETFKLGELTLNDFGPLTTTIHLYDLLDKIDTAVASGIQALDGQVAPMPEMVSQEADTSYMNEADNFQEATFSSGNIIVKATNHLPVTFDSITIIPQSYNQFNFVTLPECHFYNFLPGQTQTQTVPLQNTTLYSEFRVIILQFRTLASGSPVLINLSDGILVTVTATNLRVIHGIAKIPEQVFTSDTKNLDYISESDERITHAHFSQASVTYQVSSAIGAVIHGDFTFTSVTTNGDTAKKAFIIPPDAQTNDIWSLPNSDFDFTTIPVQPYNILPVYYQIWIEATDYFVEFDAQDSISFSFTLTDLSFTLVQGYFGEKTINLNNTTISSDIDLLSNISGTITLTNPKMNIIVTNSIGVPSNLDLEVKNHADDGNIYDLDAQTVVVPYPATPGETVQNSIPLTNANSNMSSFLSHIPKDLEFSADMFINPYGFIDYSNFVTDQGKAKIGIEFDLPLELKVNNLTFQDTAAFELNKEGFDKVESAQMYLFIKNGFPFYLNLELTVFDSITNIQYDHFYSGLIHSAEVNTQGRVIHPAQSFTTFDLDHNRIDNILKSNKLIVIAVMNTTHNGSVPVKMYTDYKIDIKLSAKATGNLTGYDL